MAKKRLNKTVVVTLALCASVTMILLSVLMLRQLQHRDPKHFIALAQRYQDDEAWEDAARFYAKVWQRTNDPAYLVRQGEMWFNDGDILRAVTAWRQALVIQPDLIEAHVHLVTLRVEYARLDGRVESWLRLQEDAEALLHTDSEKPTEVEALGRHALGLALVHLAGQDEANTGKGLIELEAAVDLAPEVTDYAVDLAEPYRRQGRLEDAEQLYRTLIDRHSSPGVEASKARLVYAKHLASVGQAFQPVTGPTGKSVPQAEEAERYFQEALALAGEDDAALTEARLGYAMFLMQEWARATQRAAGRPPRGGGATSPPGSTTGPESQARSPAELIDQAETILRQCVASDPDAFEPYVQLAGLYRIAKRHADVVEVCELRLAREFSRKGLNEKRSRLNTFRLNIFASQACVALSLTTEDPTSRESWLDKSEAYVRDARGEFPTHPRAASQAGRVKLARGQDRAALKDLREADETYRSFRAIDWENKIILARLHLRLNEPGAARAVLDEVVEGAQGGRGAGLTFWALYAQVLFQNNELDRALLICNQVLAREPGNEGAQRVKAAVYERQQRHTQARAAYGELPGAEVVGVVLKARELVLEGAIEQALDLLRRALERTPTDLRLVRTVVGELLNADRSAEAQRIVERALSVKADDPDLRRLLLLTRRDLTETERNEALLAIIEDGPDPYQRDLDLINFHIRKEDLSQVLPLIRSALAHLAAKDTPLAQTATVAHHRALLRVKLRIAAKLDDSEALDQAREEAARFNVDGAGGKSLLGLYHDLRGEPELAIKALQQAVELQPTDTAALAHLGWCLQAAGRTEDARMHLERAIRANPNEALAHKALAGVARRRGDVAAYERALESCQRLIPNDPWVRAELEARQEKADPAGAIARREETLAEHPEDYANLLRLAALSEAAGQESKADQYYGRLPALHPDDAATVALVGRFYRRSGQAERSLQLATDFAASRQTPEEQADAQILVAAHHLSLAHDDEVEAALLHAADLAETLDVTESLGEFYMFRAGKPAQALLWYDKAAERARRNRPTGKSVPKRRRLAKVLTARIGCLLHRSINDTGTARRQVDEYLLLFPDDPNGLYLDSEVHARTGHIDKAVASLNLLLQSKPGDARALYARAQRYVQLGRPARAIEDLQAVKRSDPLALALKPRLLLATLHRQADRKDAWIHELETLVADCQAMVRTADPAPDAAAGAAAANEALAEAYLAESRPADAQRIVTGQINRAAEEPDARWFYLLGRVSRAHGDPDGALHAFHRGAEIEGFSADSLTRVLNLHLDLRRIAEGIAYYQRHAAEKNTSAELVSRHARLLALAGEQERAAASFRQAMSLASRESASAARIVAGDVHRAFPTEEAIALFEQDVPQGLQPPVDGVRARANDRILMRLYRTAGRNEDADARLDQLIRTAQTDRQRGDLLYERGEMYQLSREPARARHAYEEALKYDADNWATLNNLAYLLSDDLSEYRLALPYARRAAALSDQPSALDTLGWIHVGLGQYDQAVAELSRAIRLNPNMTDIYYHLGEAYRRNGRFLQASDILESGARVARQAEQSASLAMIEESLEKVGRRDSAP